MKEYDEIWALEAGPVLEFFKDRPGDVSVIPLPDKKLGAIALPQTRVMIRGENAEEIYQQFFLHFLKAGG